MSDSQEDGQYLELNQPIQAHGRPESHPANLLTVFTETLYPGWTAQHRTMLACNPEDSPIPNTWLGETFIHPMLTLDYLGILSTE